MESRLNRALDKLARGTSVIRSRENDSRRSERNGKGKDARLEAAIERFEQAADDLWAAIKA
jgi:hypothetical protein